MEFWVVVAAAGAGYVAQHLQSSSEDKNNLLEKNQFPKFSTHEQSDNKNLLQQLREYVCPFHRLARKRAKKEVNDQRAFRFRQLNLDSSENMSSTDCTSDSGAPFNSTGIPNGMALMYMGIITGMVSAIIANRRETEKLNEKLEWTKNLVQELEEEITVKELSNDDYENPNSFSPSMSAVELLSTSSDIQVNEPTRQTSENTDPVAAEKHESMSEIEAELEAELERLEMSLKVSTFEMISDFVELDPEDEVDVAQGDLKVDCLNVQCPGSSESDRDTSETWIVHAKPANYPVSPRELSLRLHEVIESRLEARIKELETALHRSQNRACSLEIQNLFQEDFASSETEFSANLQSPYCYYKADEETIHGSEDTFDIDIRIPPLDGALINRPRKEGK
ncbi:uncharacterized protein LOC132067839 [Lycium ferocissimum]|uniref:uncharacterized protein LOC132067839 n=1 Tax=Lycium ferocissimum TaxID=112874 RepID=UPI0028164F44|nr:uncharacterized protein LOC132067839 [Lycium ferocissimum]